MGRGILSIGALVGLTEWAADAIVRAGPRGAYTTARTHGRSSVFEFETHSTRTANSARLMLEADAAAGEALPAGMGEITSPEAFRPIFLRTLSRAVAAYNQHVPETPSVAELKLTVLLVWGPDRIAAARSSLAHAFLDGALREEALARAPPHGDLDAHAPWALVTHVTALPPRRAPPVRVLVAGAPRSNASAKDSEWVRARGALEAAKGPDVEEVLLMQQQQQQQDAGGDGGERPGADGTLLEGTQTNFFAVQDGRVWTAPEGDVLGGTVRRLVLEVAAREGIPTVLQAPLLSSSRGWSGAFLSSTSRLVLPIHQLGVPVPAADSRQGASGTVEWLPVPSGSCPIVQRLEALVADEVAAHSTPLELS